MPKLAALLDISSLGLKLHCGDAETPFAAVRRLDRPEDVSWLAAGDLRLGESWGEVRASHSSDPYFVARPAAIGYALTPKRRELPPGLVEQAEKRGLDLFTIPPTVNVERVRQEGCGSSPRRVRRR